MMKKIIVLALLMMFITNPISAEYVDLTLSYPREANYGEEIVITFELINNSNDRLWDGTIAIEDSFLNQYKDYIKSETNSFKFSIVEPGESIKESFVLTFVEGIPVDKATFNIVLKCGKGMCRGGCTPFYMEKMVNINLNEERAEAAIILDNKNITVAKGETIEVPFSIKNTGNIPIKEVTVELKGEVISDSKVNISFISPGTEASGKLVLTIDGNTSPRSYNPIIIANFKDINENKGIVYENIKIDVVEKGIPTESNNSTVDEETNELRNSRPLLFYVLIGLSVLSILLVAGFVLYVYKR